MSIKLQGQNELELQVRVRNLEYALETFAKDPHIFGSRPCVTCQELSKVLGEWWGCEKKRRMEGSRR